MGILAPVLGVDASTPYIPFPTCDTPLHRPKFGWPLDWLPEFKRWVVNGIELVVTEFCARRNFTGQRASAEDTHSGFPANNGPRIQPGPRQQLVHPTFQATVVSPRVLSLH